MLNYCLRLVSKLPITNENSKFISLLIIGETKLKSQIIVMFILFRHHNVWNSSPFRIYFICTFPQELWRIIRLSSSSSSPTHCTFVRRLCAEALNAFVCAEPSCWLTLLYSTQRRITPPLSLRQRFRQDFQFLPKLRPVWEVECSWNKIRRGTFFKIESFYWYSIVANIT